MTRSSVAGVVVLTIVTLGIYGIYWFVRAKSEMNAAGASIPTGLLLIVPFANNYWLWTFSQEGHSLTAWSCARAGRWGRRAKK
ncbi:MAG: DUF4234 domain-containing protein [Candidatus Bipolaricaulota bacterium]